MNIKEELKKTRKDFKSDEKYMKHIQKLYLSPLELENIKLKEKIERLKEENYKLQKCLYEEELDVQDQNRELGIRIDKATEELEIWQPKEKILQEEKEYLLDILKGVDKE